MPVLVVLVRTRNPGNLGASARAAKNFGADLALLEPRAPLDHPEAVAYASGTEDFLRKVKTLAEWDAIADLADFVVALTSLRGRNTRGLPPHTTFEEISRSLRPPGGGARGRRLRVALVFGPERGGLTTEELRRCDARLTIPTAPELPTLNLAQSVAVALSSLFPFEAPRRRRGTAELTEQPAASRDVRRLLSSLRDVLSSAGYPGRGHSREVIAEIESFVRRGRPTAREVTLLLGAVAALRRGLTARVPAGRE